MDCGWYCTLLKGREEGMKWRIKIVHWKKKKKRKNRSYYLLSENKERAAICLDSGRAASWGPFEVITPVGPYR